MNSKMKKNLQVEDMEEDTVLVSKAEVVCFHRLDYYFSSLLILDCLRILTTKIFSEYCHIFCNFTSIISLILLTTLYVQY